MKPGSMPSLSRRNFLAAAGAMPLLALTGIPPVLADEATELSSITSKAKPIDEAERKARIARAQTLMAGHGIGAVLIEPGSSLLYFTAVNWWRSERLTCAVLPVEGEPCLVTPFFEEPSVRESLGVPAEVRVWQEHEDPVDVVAGFLREKKLLERPIGIEETVRYFVVDGLRKVLPHARLVSANPVVRGCRMRKSAAEIALMQCASDVTVAAYRWVYPRIEAGMGPQDIGALMSNATQKLGGGEGFNLILLGEASAYPHGSGKPQKVVPGEVVLMDCGCNVHGYQSDISRSSCSAASRTMSSARSGTRCTRDSRLHSRRQSPECPPVRSMMPCVATTSHWVTGRTTSCRASRIAPGTASAWMDTSRSTWCVAKRLRSPPACVFSDEPGIYIPGKFGIRLEDCFHMTAEGPRWFSTPHRPSTNRLTDRINTHPPAKL
jgi:Xaa-Pro dipeptidase